MVCAAMAAVMLACASGCALIKDGEEISWSKVDTAVSVLQTTSQLTTYGVCVKNPDLSPIFKAIGEGFVVLSASEQAYSPEQLKAYINEALDKEEWGSLASQVNAVMDTLITAYTGFYNTNKDKFKDEIIVFSKLIAGIGNGLVAGSQITTNTTSKAQAVPVVSPEEALQKLNDLDYDLSE